MDIKRDKYGKELTLEQWAKLFEDKAYKRVAHTYLWNSMSVSTVWLGLDHGFGGQPLYFETMVFKRSTLDEVDITRYQTLEQAEVGHVRIVSKHMPFIQRLWKRIRKETT